MDKWTYKKLLLLAKILDSNKIDLAPAGLQKRYLSHGIFDSKYKFDTIMNRKGHKKMRLSLMMNSNSGNMMRFDIVGKPHQGFPTPHLHIFNGEEPSNIEFIPFEKLPKPFSEVLTDPDEFQRDLELFFEYNNVELKDVVFYNPLV